MPLEDINAILSQGQEREYERVVPPVLIGSWHPHNSIDALKTFFEEFSNDPLVKGHPFYLALPYSWVASFAEKERAKECLIGTTGMCSASPGSFTEDIAVTLIRNSGASFVILDAADQEALPKLKALLDEEIPAFLRVGESHTDSIEGRSVEGLREQVNMSLKELPQDKLGNLTVIYAPKWITTQGIDRWVVNAEKSFAVIHLVLREALGPESRQKIKIALELPSQIDEYNDVINRTPYEGFHFSDISIQLPSFRNAIKLLKSLE